MTKAIITDERGRRGTGQTDMSILLAERFAEVRDADP